MCFGILVNFLAILPRSLMNKKAIILYKHQYLFPLCTGDEQIIRLYDRLFIDFHLFSIHLTSQTQTITLTTVRLTATLTEPRFIHCLIT